MPPPRRPRTALAPRPRWRACRRPGPGSARPGADPPVVRRVRGGLARGAGPAGRARARPCRAPSGARRGGCRSRRWPGRPAAGTTRGSPGRRSGSKDTRSARAGLGTDRREVLAEGVGLAEVAGAGRAELLAHRRPHAVGGHDVAGLDRGAVLEGQPDVVRARLGRGHTVPVVHLDPGLPGHVDERGVEVLASRHGAEAAVGRQLERVPPTRRRAQHDLVHRHPAGDGAGIEPEVLELAQRVRGEAVAAGLVARERAPCRRAPRTGRSDPARSPLPRRPGPRPRLRRRP